ncbi:MAG: sensor domain-containing diguanylate cyclase/phosphohydrolase [Bacillota bacterium]
MQSNQTRSNKYYRAVLFTAAYLYIIFAVFYYQLPAVQDPIFLKERLLGAGVFLLALTSSYLSGWVKARLEPVTYLIVVGAVTHLIYLNYTSAFAFHFAVSLVIVVAFVNLFFPSNRYAFYTNLVLALGVGAVLIFTEETVIIRSGYYLVYLSLAGLSYLLNTEKLRVKTKIEEGFREQELLLDSIDIQIWYLKDQETYGRVNQAYADFVGLEKSSIEDKKVDDFHSDREARLVKKGNEQVFAEKKKVKFAEWFSNSQGESRLLAITKTPILDNQNQVDYVVCSAQDITERTQKEKEVKQQRERLGYIISATNAGTWEWNVQTGELIINERWAEMLGYTIAELAPVTTETWEELSHPGDLAASKQLLDRHFQGEVAQYDIEVRMKHKDGHWVWMLNRGRVISWTEAGEPLWMFGLHLDITELKEREEQIKFLSYKDFLTGLYNRRFFEEEAARCDTERQLPISIVMADINGLKIINDSFGHEKGDELLVKAAGLLERAVREEDVLARWGGDEFIILLPQTRREEAEMVVERIKANCKLTEGEAVTASLGLGMATKTDVDQEMNDIIRKADKDMYRNKLAENSSLKNAIVKSLLSTLGAKSHETEEHAVRLTRLSQQLGRKLGLSRSELNRLSLLASLHDIGKTSVPEEILSKPGKLTDEEWEIIKEHPERGYKIASASEGFGIVAEEILSHHERWDGGGYPRGLAGEDIPYLSRIISIVDAYDVMITGRPYQDSISKTEALEEIAGGKGSQFDPELADVFIEMMKD